MRDTLEVLNVSGHLSLSWDPENEQEVAEVRAEVERLRAAGYSFFLVEDGGPADAVAAGRGALNVRRIMDPILPPSIHEPTPPIMEPPSVGDDDDPEPTDVDKRSSGYRAWKRRQEQRAVGQPVSAPGRRTVAMAPMRGG